MRNASATLWIAGLAVLLGVADIAGPLCRPVAAQQPANQSWYTPITSGVKSGFDKVGKAITPSTPKKSAPEDDATSLKSPSKPSAELYVAIGRRCEEMGKMSDAEHQYQTALNLSRDDLSALLAYARLKEQLGQKEDAFSLYQRAAKAHPKEPSVHNNIGLFFARQGRLDQAVSAISVAIRMSPKNPLYRNNIATVLVDQCRFREAYANLREVYSEAVAYYNMGYLLNKKGNTQAAMQHFAMAIRSDPSMLPAQRWVEYLAKRNTPARVRNDPAADGPRTTTDQKRWADTSTEQRRNEYSLDDVKQAPRVEMPDRDEPRVSNAATSRRLPPLPAEEADNDGPSLPGFSFNSPKNPTIPTAPLPPPSSNAAVRRLPQVR